MDCNWSRGHEQAHSAPILCAVVTRQGIWTQRLMGTEAQPQQGVC